MRSQTIMSCIGAIMLLCSGCGSKKPVTLNATFRLTHPGSRDPLANVTVSVYDGFDNTMPSFSGIPMANNKPFHFADITTSEDGTIQLDLGKFRHRKILMTVEKLHKYVGHEGAKVKIMHYIPEGYSLRVTAHYDYDLETKLVSVTRIPRQECKPYTSPKSLLEKVEPFLVIDVPMD